MNSGPRDFVALLSNFFEKEADRLHVEMAFLYGSRAGGVPRKDSDVDIALLFKEDLSEEEIFDRITAISLELGALVSLEVSILPIYHDFRKPMLYYNAVAKGFPVFVRSTGAYIRLRHEAVAQMEDFRLFGIKWQAEAARRNLSRG
jgi:predicted nucleotidyltransferase